MSRQRITLVGIGNMGAALGHALLKNDTPITVWNRTTDRPQVKGLVDAGAALEGDINAALVHNDGVVVICLLDYDTMYTALGSSASSLQGKTIVNLTTGTPKQGRDAEVWFKDQGASLYFDGGIMGTPEMVATPHMVIMYSGETEASFTGNRVPELLGPFGRAVYEGEDPGAASMVDLAALSAMYGLFAGAFVGMALLKRQRQAGLKAGEAPQVTPGVNKAMIPLVGSLVPYLSQMSEIIDQERWEDSLGNPLGMQLTALRTILRACDEEGVDGGALAGLAANMQKGVDERGGDGGIPIAGKYLLK
ncbi:hypothetical protein PLICBS_002436 [Purpureocillium lilacinum]|uniref:uncharacterized protein n=1 Tax=Purpureocillium lilacinum TaxID=33203 RepID=UPI002084FC45|nr:hypothetical protein PLICBS_002436 [Purpureocillium lilacinum]